MRQLRSLAGVGRLVSRPRAVGEGRQGDLGIDAGGEIASMAIGSDNWHQDIAIPSGARGFVRAEIVAEAARERLIGEFRAATGGASLPWQLRDADVTDRPFRRALSNPVYFAS